MSDCNCKLHFISEHSCKLDLPDENQESCVVAIDDDLIFTCGGSTRPTDTLIHNASCVTCKSWVRYVCPIVSRITKSDK